MAEQLRFDLAARPALGRDAFFVSDANATALAMIDDWLNWPERKLVLCGPEGAGKTHLAHVWAAESGAKVVEAGTLDGADIEALSSGAICVEDLDDLGGRAEAQTALFHLHNLTLAQGHPLLMTMRKAPRSLGLDLPDLVSRIQGTSLVRIERPDEALLGAIFLKLFADRQLSPQPDVIPYLATRAPRAFDAALRIVEDMDARAMGARKGLTRQVARDALRAVQPEH